MLQFIRDKLTGWVAIGIIGLIAMTFIFWGIDFGIGGDNFAVRVGDAEIGLTDFRRNYQNQVIQYQQVYPGELPQFLRDQVKEQVLETMIRNRVLVNRIDKEGYRVGEEALKDHIRQIPAFQVNGEFSLDSFQARLASQAMPEALFAEEQRRQLELEQLRKGIMETGFFTPNEFRRYIELNDERRELSWAVLGSDAFAAEVRIEDAEVEGYYLANPGRFQTEEQLTVEYVEVRVDEVAAGVAVTEDDLRGYFDSVRERFQTPEERKARHILIAVDDADEQGALDRAEQLVARLSGGEAFEDLAAEYSDDPGTRQLGGDLGWLSEGMFVGAFDDALFSMQVGETSAPVRSEFGYHLIRLDETKAGEGASFEQVRAELEEEYRTQQAEDLFYGRVDQLADAAFDSANDLAAMAEALNLPVAQISGFTRNGGGPFAANQDVIAAAFSERVLDNGENSSIIEAAPDHAIVLRVVDHIKPELKPQQAVADEIREILHDEAAQNLAAGRGDDIVRRLQGGEDIQPLLETLDVEYHRPRFVKRDDSIVPPAVLRAAFAAPKPVTVGSIVEGLRTDEGDYAFFELSAVRLGEPSMLSRATRDQDKERLGVEMGRGEMNGYVEEARNNSEVYVSSQVTADDFE